MSPHQAASRLLLAALLVFAFALPATADEWDEVRGEMPELFPFFEASGLR